MTYLYLLAMLAFGASSQCSAQPVDAVARGKLLYTTHCASCHTAQIHWREMKLVSNWNDLKFQVNRWQKAAVLGWGEEDIEQVSAYLNGVYYHFPDTEKIGLGLHGARK